MEEKLNSSVPETEKKYYRRLAEAGLKPGVPAIPAIGIEIFKRPAITPTDPYKGHSSADMVIASLKAKVAELEREVEFLKYENEMLEEIADSYLELGSPKEITDAFCQAEEILESLEDHYGTFEQIDYIYSEFATLQETQNAVLIIGKGGEIAISKTNGEEVSLKLTTTEDGATLLYQEV